MIKKNRIAIISVLILAVIATFLLVQNRRSTLKKEMAEFAIDDTARVTKIFLVDKKDNRVLLKKIRPGYWTLNDKYKARIEGITLLLKTMENLAVKSPVSKASYNNVVKRLATTAVKVEIYEKVYRINLFNRIKLFPHEKLTKVYYVGNPTPDNIGTFMLMQGSDVPFVVYQPGFRGFVAAQYSARTNDWRDHTIFAQKPSQIKSIKVEFPQQPEESFLVEKFGDKNLLLTDLYHNRKIESFDTIRMVNFINSYKKIRYEAQLDLLEQSYIDSVLFSTPVNIITLTDTAGNVNRVKTFRRRSSDGNYDFEGNLLPYDLDRLYASINDGKEFVLIQYFVFDPITRPLSYLTKREK